MSEDSGRRIIAGSYSEMKTQLMLLKQQSAQGGGGLQTADDREFPEWKDKILVKLSFYGKTNTGKVKEVDNSLKLIKHNAATYDDAKIAELARLIRTKFNTMTLLLGKKSYSYCNPRQGVKLKQMYLKDESEARKLVEQILDINGESPDWTLLREHSSVVPDIAYSETPGRTIVAGTTVKLPQRRPYGTVNFSYALVKFPGVPFFQILCKKSGFELSNLNWLRKNGS
jgi:hypothetical protein